MYLVLALTSTLFYWYYSKFKKIPKIINAEHLFPSNNDLLNNNVMLYSRINYLGKDTILLNRNILSTYEVKEHSKRESKIKMYTSQRINDKLKLKLILWANHIRYKPGSSKYLEIKDRWVNLYKNNITIKLD